jgi:hypothetical protein
MFRRVAIIWSRLTRNGRYYTGAPMLSGETLYAPRWSLYALESDSTFQLPEVFSSLTTARPALPSLSLSLALGRFMVLKTEKLVKPTR